MSHEHFGTGKTNDFDGFQRGQNEPEDFDLGGRGPGWSNFDPNQGSRGEFSQASWNGDWNQGGRPEYGSHRGFRHGDQFGDEQGEAKSWKINSSMDTSAVFQTASNVARALQAGDVRAARHYADEVDPRCIRAAKMQLFGEMRDAGPDDQQALLQQGRDLRTLQRASFAFDLMRNGEERDGQFLLHHLMHSGKLGHRDPDMQPQDADMQSLDGEPNDSSLQPEPTTQNAYDYANTGNLDQIDPNQIDPNQLVDRTNYGTTANNADVVRTDSNDVVNPQGMYDGSPDPQVTTDGSQDQSVVTDGTQNQPVVTDGTQKQSVVTDGDQPVTTTDANVGDQNNTATSPLRTLMALAQQLSSGQQTLTPDVKAAFESAIQQADAGESPILAALRAQFDQQSQKLQAAIPDTAVSSMQTLDQQANQQIASITDPTQQSQAKALYSMLDSATSAEDKAAIRQQLLALVPGLDSILTQRDQVTAPFDQQIFALNSLGQQISGEQNQAAATRMIYAQVLASSGDTAGASAQLDAAIAKNTDANMTDYLQQATQSLARPATAAS